MSQNGDRTYDCIVLGAGIAGVTAARNLQFAGFDVLLVEGSDRIGGRMYSVRDRIRNPDYRPHPENPREKGKFLPIEAGAEYVHVQKQGKTHKEFWQELDDLGFATSTFHKTGNFVPFELPRNRTFFPVWGKTRKALDSLSDPEVLPVAALLPKLMAYNPKKKRDISARTYARKHYEGRGLDMAQYTLSAHTPGVLDEPAGPAGADVADPNDTISIGGIAADKIPAQLIEPAEHRIELRSRRFTPAICGYDTLPLRIAAQFRGADGTVRMSAEGQRDMKVTSVRRTADGAIEVATAGGATFLGRTAVCTFSVGMLDPEIGEGPAIFGDLLTAEKRQALALVKMGPITKLSLEFRERFWKHDGLWAGHMSVLSNPLGTARTFFSSFPDLKRGPHVLTGLLMSKDHLAIKDLDDGEAIQRVLDALQAVYDPDHEKPGGRWTPERVMVGETANGTFEPSYLRQDWSRDEFAKGGNSFQKYVPPAERTMSVTATREALKNPRATLPLFWAGEATAPAYHKKYQPLAVHGAYISGVRVAEDVAHYLGKAKGDAARFEKYYRKRYLGKRR